MTYGRRDCRAGRPCAPETLAEAIYCVVHHSEVTARTIAERIPLKYKYLLDSANPDRHDFQFQARLILPVTLMTNNDAIVEYLAREAGGEFIRLPQRVPGHEDLFRAHLAAVREFGADAEQLGELLADGVVTPEEADRWERRIEETAQRVLELGPMVRRRVKAEARR